MTLKKNNPGCNCCGDSCTEYTDDFATDPYASPERWTEVSGSWSGGSGALTPSGAGLTVFNQAMPSSMMAMRMRWSGFANGDIAQFIVAYEDSSNYLFARVTIGSTTAKCDVYKVQGGSATVVATGNSVNRGAQTEGIASVCYNPFTDRLSGNFLVNANMSAAEGVTSAATLGEQAGIEITGTSSGSFEIFALGDNTGDCKYCVGICNLCEDNLMPISLQIDVEGVTGGAFCSDSFCEGLNGTYILHRSGPCTYELLLGGSGDCALNGVFAAIQQTGFFPNVYTLTVNFQPDPFVGAYYISRSISYTTNKPDCMAWDRQELSASFESNACVLSSSTHVYATSL